MFSLTNKKVLGKMKDETAGIPIKEFVGLRPKLYSFVVNGVEKKRAKGVKTCVLKKRIRHADYVNCLNDGARMCHNMGFIRSDKHELYTVRVNKCSLSAFDDKRYLLDNIMSYAFGHYRING